MTVTFSRLKSWVVFLYFSSGVCSLVYQVVWQRLLKLTLGNTTYASSITVATFLGGLALGSFLVRQRVDAIPNKLKTYALLEIAISLVALVSPWVMSSADGLYVMVYQGVDASPILVTTLQIIVSVLVLLVPTVLMGTTLPLVSSWLVESASQTGRWVGKLYSLNTFGAMVGCALSGFYLIRLFGVHETLYLAVAVNLALAGIAWWLSLQKLEDAAPPEPYAERRAKEIDDPATKRLIKVWLFASGFIAIGYEIVWMRTIVHFLRAEIFVFTAVLAMYLFGYALGAMAGSRILRKGPDPIRWFTQSFVWVGVYGVFYIVLLASVGAIGGVWFRGLIPVLVQQPSYVLHLFYSLILFVLPSFMMGLGFPFLIQAWRRYYDRTGATVSVAYSINALGCVLGGLCAGLLLIPNLGAQWTSNILGIAAIALACWGSMRIPTMLAKVAPFAGLVLAYIGLVKVPHDAYLQWINVSEGRGEPVELIDAVEGVNTTASVHHYLKSDTRVISSAGINVAGDQIGLRTTQKVQAHLPILLHGNPKEVLTVGFGSGELTKTLTFHDIPNISLVEIAPEMVRLSKKHFKHINLGDDIEKRLNITYMDAKNFMHLTNRNFDVIMNDSIWPGSFAESSSLYTYEYWMEGKERLNENGVYSTWLPVNIPKASLRAILKTFNDVFANVTVWYPHNALHKHLLLVGQKNPYKYSYVAMRTAFEKPAVKQSMALLNVATVDDAIDFVMSEWRGIAKMTANDVHNSDYYPVVEFDVDRIRQTDTMLEHLELIMSQTPRIDFEEMLSFEGLSDQERESVLERLKLKQRANEFLFKSYAARDYWDSVQAASKGLEINPGDVDLTAQLNRLYSIQPPAQP
jgi:spermidine synthase